MFCKDTYDACLGLPGFMRGDPFLKLGHMAALLGDKFLGQHLDLGIVGRVKNGLVIFKTRRLRIERDLKRLLAANQGIGGPDRGRLRTFQPRPNEIAGLYRGNLAKTGTRLRVGEMQSRIIRQPAKKLSHFAIAAGFHCIGQLPKAGRGLLFEMDGVSEKFLDCLHCQLFIGKRINRRRAAETPHAVLYHCGTCNQLALELGCFAAHFFSRDPGFEDFDVLRLQPDDAYAAVR